MSDRLGFVPVRAGDDLVGGAEMLVAELVDALAARGHAVDLLTGTNAGHFSDLDAFAPGVTERPSGARLLRFPAVASRARADRVLGNRRLDLTGSLDAAAAAQWCHDDVRVPGLVDHLAAHAGEYRALVFAPYLYWTTLAGTLVDPARTILLPCLHDEPTAGLAAMDRMFTESRGVWFLTDPEADLARRRHPGLADHVVIGSAVAPAGPTDGDRFRARHGVDGPFVLMLGRREAGKAFAGAVADFVAAADRVESPLRLVTAGPGAVHLDARTRARVVDVGRLTPADRDDALAAATALLQPSPHESFSRVMMEAWQVGTPVIATAASAVSAWHVERSGGGCVYAGTDGLADALRAATDPAFAARGAAGAAYVAREYTWPVVLDRVEASLDAWRPAGGPPTGPTGPSGRRAVVVGPFPPATGPLVEAVLDATRSHWAAGDAVTVVSPSPSVADRHADPATRRGVRHLARLLTGADAVVVAGSVPPRLARVLATAASVERVVPDAAPAPRTRTGLGRHLSRLRAGLPTWLRSWRRA